MSLIDGANNVNQYTAIDDETSTCPTPSTPVEELVYDADGNLVSDGTRVYSWDAENRLVAVAPAVPAAGDKKVVFTYDYMSRRVQKRVFAWNATLNGGAGDWEANPEVYQRFVYDQWNVVLVLDGPNRTITHKYTWGLDFSGLAGRGAAGAGEQSRDREGAVPGIHDAGGIGGLLAVEAPQSVGDPLRHWYCYDGNGNVGQLLAYDATGPTVNAAPAAKYEYDPYGQLVNWTDTIGNPFRFSTKWFDTTTGLGYWGYRYYSPRLGRWMSRDPLADAGFPLLGNSLETEAGFPSERVYAFVGNRVTSHVDVLGLLAVCDQEYSRCVRDKLDRYDDCLSRASVACTILCAVKCPGGSKKCLVICVPSCMAVYTKACRIDRQTGQDCCADYRADCEKEGSWPGWCRRRTICTFFH